MEEPTFEVMKGLATLLGEYREVTGKMVRRYDHNHYIRASDRDILKSLNGQVDHIVRVLQNGTNGPVEGSE